MTKDSAHPESHFTKTITRRRRANIQAGRPLCTGSHTHGVILRCTRDSRSATRQTLHGTIPAVSVTSSDFNVREKKKNGADDSLACPGACVLPRCPKSGNGVSLYSLILRCTRDSCKATRQISHGTIPGVLVGSGALVRRELAIGADDALA
jgi:hypothetical protein